MKVTKKFLVVLLFSMLLISLSISVASAQTQPLARALLFYSPSCGHCEYVITEVLPPLFDEFGDQLLILGIDTSSPIGSELFMATIEESGFPMEQAGVPFLVVSDQILVGSGQIPEQFPSLVNDALAADGIAWPSYQAIQDFLLSEGFINAEGQDITPTPAPALAATEAPVAADNAVENTPEPTATGYSEPTEVPTEVPDTKPMLVITDDRVQETLWETLIFRFNHDRTANIIAVIVLLFLTGVVVYIAINFMRATVIKPWPDWILPVLLVIGLGIAGYLASIELTGTDVVCGPVGDCNAVQQSKYATLFGFLPVAILGIIGYLAIGTTWLVGKKATGKLQFYAKLGMFFAALFGLLFFIYLTFLEPFVIGATCAWCITSAIIMAVINLFTLPIVLEAWDELDDEDIAPSEE